MKVRRREIEAFLVANGWASSRRASSHEAWTKPGCARPAIVDHNCDELPEEHIRSILRAMGLHRNDLRKFLRTH